MTKTVEIVVMLMMIISVGTDSDREIDADDGTTIFLSLLRPTCLR